MNYLLVAGGTNPSDAVTMIDSLLLSLVGFAIVFVVLAILILVIKIIVGVLKKQESSVIEDAPSSALEKAKPLMGTDLAPGSTGNMRLNTVDDKTAAMVMAIVADELETPLNELRFISIKETADADTSLDVTIKGV